jgi:hypothetical protein
LPPSLATSVYSVNGVFVDILKSNPPCLQIVAIGTVNSGGWTNARLEPAIYFAPPADGIWDFDFKATPPKWVGAASMGFVTVTAKFLWRDGIDVDLSILKGVRVRAATNTVEKRLDEDASSSFTGDVAAPDYENWVGKRFIRIGETDPGGDGVLEERLHADGLRYVVIEPHGPADPVFDPCRLRIHVGEGDSIVALGWG